jgi:hypothetical protein
MPNKQCVFFLFLLTWLSAFLLPQNNLGDSKNETTIGVAGRAGGLLSFNVIDKKVAFEYGYISQARHNFINFKISGPLEDDFSELYSKGSPVADMAYRFQMGFSVIKRKKMEGFFVDHVIKMMSKPNFKESMKSYNHPIVSTARDLWILLSAKYSLSKHKLFYPGNNYEEQIVNKNFNGYGFDIGLNYWTAQFFKLDCSLTLGASIGIQKANNLDGFVEREIESFTEFKDETTGETRKIKAKTIKAFEIIDAQKYEERDEFPLKLDIYLNPHSFKNIGFLAYSRWFFQSSADYATRNYVGAGVYFFKNRDPLDSLGGMICEIIDELDLKEDERSFKNRIKVFFTIGIKLFGPPAQ